MGVLTVFIIFPTNYMIFVDFLPKNNFHLEILKLRMKVMKLTNGAKNGDNFWQFDEILSPDSSNGASCGWLMHAKPFHPTGKHL